MRKGIKKLTSVLLMLAMLASVIGCGSGSTSSGTSSGDSEQESESTDTGTEIDVAIAGEPTALDPMCGATDRTSGAVYNNIYDSLLKADENGNILPNLAEYEQLDDVTYKFTVYEGIYFHNGEELKASDIAFTMKKGAETAITKYIWGSIDTDSIEILDDYSLQVSLTEPNAAFLALMTSVPAAILNEKYVTEVGDGSGTAPIGTGPYKFVSWDRGDNIVLERFDDYRGELPDVTKVTFHVIPESTNRTIELESGSVDIAYDIPVSDLTRVEEEEGLNLLHQSGNAIRYIGFNTQKAPFDNLEVRQAVASAIDIQGIVDAVLQGTGTVAVNPISSNIKFFDSDAVMRPYDPEGAKEKLAELGYEDGFTTTIWTDESQENVSIATILQAQLAEVGITADIKVAEWGAHVTSCYNGEIDIYIFNWSCASPDPDIIFNSVFNSQTLGEGGNCSRLVDDRVDELLKIGHTSMDEEERAAAYKELQERIYELVPWVYLWVYDVYVGTNSRIESMTVSPLQTHAISSVVLSN